MYYSGEQSNLYGYNVKDIDKLPAYGGGNFTLDPAISNITRNRDRTLTFQYGFPMGDINEWGYYRRVSSDDEIEEGKRYLIVYESSKTSAQVFSGISANNFGTKVQMNISGTYIINNPVKAQSVTLEKAESGNWYIRCGNNYLAYDRTSETGYNYLYLKDSRQEEGTEWNVTSTYIQNMFNTNRYLQYNTMSTALRFACYTGKQENVVLYKEMPYDAVEVEIPESGYTTLYYGDTSLIIPEEVTAYTYWFDNDNGFEESFTYETGEILPQATAVVLKGCRNMLYRFATTTDVSDKLDSSNALRGSDEEALTTGGDKYYMLALAEGSDDVTTVGFYLAPDDGAPFTSPAHKAYLPLSSDQAADAQAYLLDGSVLTAIRSANQSGNTPAEQSPVYDLQGRRLTPTMLLRPGIYIRGGRKFVVK